VRELYFPLPYNDEQVSIIRKLEHKDGVVVQGPPGTGKTHTIANVICHYLAQGKRVLVTSKADTALAVLQDKLPDRIRELSVALLADETDGMKQFENSIGKIAAQVSSLRIEQLEANITEYEEVLNVLHAQIAAVDQDIAATAARHMRKYAFQGKDLEPHELAKLVIDQTEDHQWFTDVLPADASEPPLTDEDVARLREARQHALRDLESVHAKLPSPSKLPSWDTLLGVHKDIVKARSIGAKIEAGAVHGLKDSSPETFEEAKRLLATLNDHLDVHARVAKHSGGLSLRDRFRKIAADEILFKSLFELRASVNQLDDARKVLVAKAVAVPEGAETNEDYLAAVDRLVLGLRAFTLPFGKGAARKLVGDTTVEGSAPERPQWSVVKEAIVWRKDAKRVLARYSTMAAEFGLLAVPPGSLEAGVKHAQHVLTLAELVRNMVFETEKIVLSAAIQRVFGTEIARAAAARYDAELPGLVESLESHLEQGRLGHALTHLTSFCAALDGTDAVVGRELTHILSLRVGTATENEDELRKDWAALVAEARRLDALRPHFQVIADCSRRLAEAGATSWARRIETEPPTQDLDLAMPMQWREAWAWRVAFQLLERIDAHTKLRASFVKRRELTTKLGRVYEDLVAERAWLGVCKSSSMGVRQALSGYLTSIKAMGSGTGIRALRHRKNARAAMSSAHRAVPCWVLPSWRVSETLPAELSTFDLVVIDEASQSDIWALPALLRGKKLLVVGDHKQVSPLVVGMPEQRIVDIQHRFLDSQPHGRYMTPDASIYDLSSVVFAGNSVMLKEHFRCAPAIIEYSNREFYQGEIRSLRVPKASERLDPPLIDVVVKGGYRKGDKNIPEAEAIVQQIEAIVADGSLAGRTIGVVTLLGNEQAKYILELVNKRIAGEEIIAREISVGPPPVFQGRERDIMMVSMVLQAGNNTASNILAQQQRFNVALSRARDRTYLFRSVPDHAFPADSLSGRLLRHFRQPFAQDPKAVTAARELCESPFEEEVYDELSKRGYRVQPQVRCGGYRIDMVVEGIDGRRLAIECDGDKYHGPGKWIDDMARQRVLERAGWVFWRCFASSFVRRRQEVLDDLWAELAKLKIEPLGDEEAGQASSVWVKRIEVDPFNMAEAEAAGAEEAVDDDMPPASEGAVVENGAVPGGAVAVEGEPS
jgi:very-short-patch-repair endonuclease